MYRTPFRRPSLLAHGPGHMLPAATPTCRH